MRTVPPHRAQAARAGSGPALRAMGIGEFALRALQASNGIVHRLPSFPDAPYVLAGDEIVWLGVRVRSLHPRMVVLDGPPGDAMAGLSSGPVLIDFSPLAPWRTRQLPSLDPRACARFVERTRWLQEQITRAAVPRGFGTLLRGGRPLFPLDLAVTRVERFFDALQTDDPVAIEAAGVALLGVGTGLTPSGDDLVGGALFARRVLASDHGAIDELAGRLISQAHARTHVISAALFADLARGASYGVLHDVVDALASAMPIEGVIDRTRALVVIGHSSGWDMLTGFIAAATGGTVRLDAPDRAIVKRQT